MIPGWTWAADFSASSQLLARRLQLPIFLLVALLQRTPALRWLLVGDFHFTPTGPGFFLRSSAVLGVLTAGVDTLAGATTEVLNPVPPTTATVGQQFDATFQVTGTPSEPLSYTVGNLPPGLTVPTSTTNTFGLLINAASGSISGVPTTAGTYDVLITAWKRVNAAGPNYALNYRIVVAAGSGPAATAPTLTTQPASATVNAGQSVTFSVTATGTPTPTYQWRKDNTALAGATAASFTLTTTTSTDAGNYTVIVTNSAGSITSAAATLTVNATPAPITAPTLTSQPSPLTLTTGQAATLTLAASGTAPLTYQWSKDGVALTGATAASYSLASATTADAGSYSVTVTNSAGSVTSNSVAVTVTAPASSGGSTPSTPPPTPTAPTTTPAFTAQPADLTATVGGSGNFSATLNSETGVTLAWQFSGNNGLTWTTLSDDATHRGTTTRTLTLATIDATMNGRLYRLLATFSGGTATSDSAALLLPAALFAQPAGLVLDAQGRLLITDQSANVLLRATPGGVLTLLAGTRGLAGSADGTAATFNQPVGLAVAPDGTVYLADSANALIRVRRPDGSVATFAGSASQRGFANGTNATFSAPLALALDPAGNLYVADSANHLIRKITPAGVVSTFAGTGGVSGSRDGTDARFNTPSGLACDSAGNLYVADTNNNTIRKITPAGTVSTLAGLAGVSGAQDGSGTSALFNQPRGLTVSPSGQLYVADTGNSSLRRVSLSGSVTTIAGLSTISGKLDDDDDDDDHPTSTPNFTWFDHPLALAVDGAGNLYIADTGNRSLRRVATDGSITTLSFTLETAHITGSTTLSSSASPNTTPSAPTTTSSGSGSSGGGGGGLSESATLTLAILLAARRGLNRRTS